MSGPDPSGQAISGSLEDVVVSDVLQFIQLGKRSGTLVLRRRTETATVGFTRGRLVAVTAPRTPKVGTVLLNQGLIDRQSLEQLLEDRSHADDLGRLRAAASGPLDEAALEAAVTAQLEQGAAEILRWESGAFEFVVDDLSPIDDLVLLFRPGEREEPPDARAVIIEATRIFDARSRRPQVGGAQPAPAPAPSVAPALELAADELRDAVDALATGGPQPAADLLELQAVSDDAAFTDELRRTLEHELARVTVTPIQRAGEAAIGAPPPIVLLDVRDRRNPGDALGAVRSAHPLASVVALVAPGDDFGRVYAAGALAAVPADVKAVVACVENIIENRRDLVRGQREAAQEGGVARLRRMMDDLRSGVMSATMALNLMQVISESVERAVLFLVKANELAVLGAFGYDRDGRLLATSARGLRVSLSSENLLTRAVRTGTVATAPFDEANLPEPFKGLIGRPANGTAVVFPVLGAQRVIAAVYADNADRPEPVQDIEILELATVQVGIAFENELLRRQLGGRPR